MSRQSQISRGKGLPPTSEGREGALSVRTVRGMGIQLAYKLGSKWYYTKLNDRPVDNGTTLNTSKMPRIPGELSLSHSKLYVKPSSSESAKEVLFNNNNASIGAGRLSLGSDKTITSSDGAVIHIDAHYITDNYTATGGTTTFGHVKIEPPVLKASNAAVTTSHAGTLEITGPPSAGLNQTITNPYDIYLSNASSKIGATDLTIDVAGGQLTIESSAAGFADPDLILIGKHDSLVGYATLQLESHRNGTDNSQDNDILGEIGFYGYNDNGDRTLYSAFYTTALDVSDGDERAKFYFQVLTNSAASAGSGLQTGLALDGSTTDDIVDASIAYGAASTTTIAGDLSISGDEIESAGDLQVDCGGILKLDAHTTGDGEGVYFQMAGTRVADINVHHFGTYLRMYENGGNSTDDYFDIGVFEHGRTELRTKDNSASAAHLEIDVDGHTKFDGTGVGFVRTTYADATNVTVDFRTGNKAHLDMTGGSISGTLTLQFPAVSGNFILVVQQDGSTRTINAFATKDEAGNTGDNDGAGDGAVRWAGGSAPDLTDGSNKRDILAFYWDATEEVCYGQASLNF